MGRAAATERERILFYWLLRCYQSGHREGWEEGPSVSETMDRLHDFLCNEGLDPALPFARRLLKAAPVFALPKPRRKPKPVACLVCGGNRDEHTPGRSHRFRSGS